MEQLYYTSSLPGSFGSAKNLSKYSQKNLKEVNDWLTTQDAYTLHKPVIKKFRRRKTLVPCIDHLWQMDLADVTNISRYNDNYKFILICIDCFSRYAYAVPIKNKSAFEIKNAFASILQGTNARPTYVQTDKGREFVNAIFLSYLSENGIFHYTSENDDTKCSVVERFIRTLKTKMWRFFTFSKSFRFIEVLQMLVQSYNSSTHGTIKMSPCDVSPQNEQKLLRRQYGPRVLTFNSKRWKYNIGDSVRISKTSKSDPFRKGYEPGWQKEVFVISGRFPTDPPTYSVKDYSGEEIKGKFYGPELQKVTKRPDVFEVEKILRTKIVKGKKLYLVRWEGYGPKHDSWVNEIDM